jgi:hypothetical protein
MKNLLLSCLATCLIIFASCGSKKEQSGNSGFGYESKEASSPVSGKDGAALNNSPIPPPVERKLIKNGDVHFKTKNLKETKSNIQKRLGSFGGYIAKENSYDYSENPTEELVIRVPAQNFDALLESILKGADQVDSKSINIEDVTEQFVDIEARLKNKKQLEDKYRELLVKAGNMEDILKIEKEISTIREDVEATEGRLKYLSNQVSLSTLRITYYERKMSGFNFGGKLGDAVGNGGTGFLWFLIVMVQLWPLWLIGGLIWFIIVRMIRRAKKRKQAG